MKFTRSQALVLLTWLAVVTATALADDQAHNNLRRLPGGGYADVNLDDYMDLNNAELGFAAGVLFAVVLICCLLCMCCGGGSRCSLWDCLALFCIWEICCDGRNPNDFVLV